MSPWDEITNGVAGGLLGVIETDEARRHRKALGLDAPETPNPLARIGRGFTDIWEPIQQGYYNTYRPQQAPIYRKQRAADEALYQRGLLGLHPEWSSHDPEIAMRYGVPGADTYRVIGQSAVAAPFLGGVGPTVANAYKNTLYDNLIATYRQLRDRNLLHELPSWMRP